MAAPSCMPPPPLPALGRWGQGLSEAGPASSRLSRVGAAADGSQQGDRNDGNQYAFDGVGPHDHGHDHGVPGAAVYAGPGCANDEPARAALFDGGGVPAGAAAGRTDNQYPPDHDPAGGPGPGPEYHGPPGNVVGVSPRGEVNMETLDTSPYATNGAADDWQPSQETP